MGMFLVTAGPGFAYFLPSTALLGAIAFVLGLLITVSGFFTVVLRRSEFIERWDMRAIHTALLDTSANSTVRILQTWFPDKEDFIPFLQELLTTGHKHFRFQILLVDDSDSEGGTDILAARVKLRREARKEGADNLRSSIEQLIEMKKHVDATYAQEQHGTHVDLEIRVYDFLPFGPIYQIGDDVMFVGFYPNNCSSLHAPMITICDNKCRSWALFERHFTDGWKSSRAVYDKRGRDT